jgi:dihydroorotase
MILLKNIRFLDTKVYSVAIAEGEFTRVSLQEGLEPPLASSITLARYAELSEDREWCRAQQKVVVDAEGELLVPGAIDVHVHSRDPGFPEKETWQTLGQAAFRGGVVAVVDMPNTFPPTMNRDQVLDKALRAQASGLDFRFLLGVGSANLSSLSSLLQDKTLPICGLKIFYGQSTGNLQFADLDLLASKLPQFQDYMLVFHAEDQCCIEENTRTLSPSREYASLGSSYAVHSELRDSRSAVQATAAILRWAKRWGRAVHIAHVSTPAEMELIVAARREGLKVSSEVCPHHLLFSTADYERLGGFLKVNPPVRSPEEVVDLRRYFARGAIDCFATDHAPHTREEKQRPYAQCPSGIPAVEFFWPLFYRAAQSSGASIPDLVSMVSLTPAKLFGFSRLGALRPGFRASWAWVKRTAGVIAPTDIRARCQWSPYQGEPAVLSVQATWQDGICRYLG